MPDKQTEHLIATIKHLKDAVGHLRNGLPHTTKLSPDAETKFSTAFANAGAELEKAKSASDDPTRS